MFFVTFQSLTVVFFLIECSVKSDFVNYNELSTENDFSTNDFFGNSTTTTENFNTFYSTFIVETTTQHIPTDFEFKSEEEDAFSTEETKTSSSIETSEPQFNSWGTFETSSTSDEFSSTIQETSTFRSPSCEVSKFVLNNKIIGKVKLTTEWYIKPKYQIDYAKCKLSLLLSCNSSNTDMDFWIIPYRFIETEIETENFNVSLNDLSENTNYSCTSQLRDENNNISEKIFSFSTFKGVPSNVNFTIIGLSSKNVTLKWKKPYKLPGDLLTYHIMLENLGPKHFIRENCTIPLLNSTSQYYSKKKSVTYTLVGLKPNFEYKIQVLAENEAGNSTGIPLKFLTNSSSSSPPLNVSSKIINVSRHCNGESYNTSLYLTWEFPCNTNGNFKEFRIDIESNNSLETWFNPKNEDIEDISYSLIVQNLNASTIYQIIITPISEGLIEGEVSINRSERTPDGCPSNAIQIIAKDVTSSEFNITWEKPKKYYGEILQYVVDVENLGPNINHYISDSPECPKILRRKYVFSVISHNFYSFKHAMPDFNYRVRVKAQTLAGFGEYSSNKHVTTKMNASTPVRNMTIKLDKSIISSESYEFKVMVRFKEPCNTDGAFKFYGIKAIGHREGPYKNDVVTIKIPNINSTSNEITLHKPEYNYTFIVEVVTNDLKSNIVTSNILTDSGIPPINSKEIKYTTKENTPTQIDITMDKDVFSDDNGNVLYYAIMFAKTEMKSLKNYNTSYGFWKDKWPKIEEIEMYPLGLKNIIQVTPNFWNPFKDAVIETKISIGKTTKCDFYCGALQEDTSYVLIFRGLTKSTYSDLYVLVRTGKSYSYVGTILTVFLLLIIISITGITLYYIRRKKLWFSFKSISNTSIIEEIQMRYTIPVKNFISYYNKITNDPTLLRKQYDDIEDETKVYKENNVKTTFALKAENRRKNRYTNILPYDEYRVKLNIDEDDEMSSDYINASYIKGCSGKVEYIATQGPLEHTCRDFWKMVIQENVSVIVMVSLFVEKEKEKCYKYFPNNHETMLISEDIEVKCLSEVQLDLYSVRNILVRKDVKQFSVVHIQYLEWPDFGCPKDTKNMINFCRQIRDRIQLEKGLMIVHCSAGVGRTGTLISLDMLLQQIKYKKEISIYDTVMELRRQRTHMVQTEKQYIYLHTCIKDALVNPEKEFKTNQEPIYQNMQIKFKKTASSRLDESAF